MHGEQPKVLLLDIETLPNIVTSWGLRVDSGYLDHENILAERYIVCAAWKWLDGSKVHSASILSHKPKRGQVGDFGVLRKLHGVMSEADAIIAHNGDSFDIPWIRTRLLLTDMHPPPPVPTIDTRQAAKRRFYFNSNRLDYLGKFLKVGRKIKTDFDLWKRAMVGDRKAIEEMVRYNREDVALLERVYLKLRPSLPARLNLNHWSGEAVCPSCGSQKMQSRGFGVNAASQYQRFQCQECGAWSKKPMNSKVVR